MSQIEKLKTRFRTCPPDFTWDELVRLLKRVGYVEKTGAGSRRKFRCKGRAAINLHQPHPGRIVKQYALRQVKETLASEGLL